MSAPSITRGLALALGGAVAVAAVLLAVESLHDALVVSGILAAVGAVTVIGVRAVLVRRARLGRLGRQLTAIGAVVLAQLAVAVGVLVALMFVSAEDALLTGLAIAYACLLGVWAVFALTQRVLGDLNAVGSGLEAIGAGERDLAIRVEGADELAGLAADVERMVARVRDEERARAAAEAAHRDLLASVSHDLRTPITSLRLLSEALQDELVDERERREYVARIGTHVRALGALIDDLFELSRLQAGDVRWTIENVALDELVAETVDAMRPAAAARSVAVRTVVPAGLDGARGNPERIQRVLFNLLHNAIRHTPADGSITVRVRPTAETVEIEVADTGSGIPREQRERVFDAFVQGHDRSARSDGSAGLGLAISRAIVEAHGGRIWLADARVGTRVRFSLPRAADGGRVPA